MTQTRPTPKRAAARKPAAPAPAPAEAAAPDSVLPDDTDGPRVLKKYPNRRLYDSRSSSYITLADVKQMVLSGEDFVVVDAKTGEDLSRSILLQIILEEESEGEPMFSTRMLENIIRFYGHTMQGLMGNYLEKNLLTFIELQKRLAEQSAGLMDPKAFMDPKTFMDPKAFSPEVWAQFISQAPMMQGLMGNYLDQSRQLFAQMQEQMTKQAGSLFPGMPGMPGVPGFAPRKDDDKAA
ncbi:MAG: polyhydroxyalkanoate synthesis repressor PhaR [Aquabacterium sp.]|nr:polyhydroxyalkanoate synthesis repressor PhaR [Aquabacterium sp.]